jgi:hypothetical protein
MPQEQLKLFPIARISVLQQGRRIVVLETGLPNQIEVAEIHNTA